MFGRVVSYGVQGNASTERSPCSFPCIAHPVIYDLSHPEMRHRHPIDPIVVVFLTHATARSRGGQAADQASVFDV